MRLHQFLPGFKKKCSIGPFEVERLSLPFCLSEVQKRFEGVSVNTNFIGAYTEQECAYLESLLQDEVQAAFLECLWVLKQWRLSRERKNGRLCMQLQAQARKAAQKLPPVTEVASELGVFSPLLRLSTLELQEILGDSANQFCARLSQTEDESTAPFRVARAAALEFELLFLNAASRSFTQAEIDLLTPLVTVNPWRSRPSYDAENLFKAHRSTVSQERYVAFHTAIWLHVPGVGEF